ncbi:MAG TPA: hypothetical protein VH639_23730 [Bryobacteraceae bacterium]
MSRQVAELQEATIKAQCRMLRMPMIASQFSTLADQAIREKKATSDIWRLYWRWNSRSVSGTRSNGAFVRRTFRA